MGCASSKQPAASSSPPPAAQPAAQASTAPSSQSKVSADPATNESAELIEGEKSAKQIEDTKQITKEAFDKGIKKILDLAIDGYPKALQSTLARRNQMLRETKGEQDKAADKIKDQAASMKEEAKNWLLALVPFVGLPASILFPTWKLIRRVCLLAGVYGLDLSLDDTRGRILHVFGGLRAVPAAEYAMETAVQLVWVAFAGPIAGLLPVGTLVTYFTNVEGIVVDQSAKEIFGEKSRQVPESEYMEMLDPEPTAGDYIDLAKKGTAAALVSTWKGGKRAVDVAKDKDRRGQAIEQATEATKAAGKTTLAVGQGAAVIAMEQGSRLTSSIASKAQGVVGGGKGDDTGTKTSA